MLQELLSQHREQGKIHARSLYHDWLKLNSENPIYQSVLKQLGSTPRNLFEDLVEELQPEFDKTLKQVREALADVATMVQEGFESFEKAVQACDTLKFNPEWTRSIFDTLVTQLAKEKKAADRRARHQREDYEDLCASKNFNLDTVTWEEAKERLAKHSAYRALSSEGECQHMFQCWLVEERARGSRKRDHDEDDSEEEGEHRSKKKKHKKEKKKHKHRSKSRKRSRSRS